MIAEVRPATPHGNRAWERFTPDGPLALLPLGQDYSVVFIVPPEKAEHLPRSTMLASSPPYACSSVRASISSHADHAPPTRSPCAYAGNSFSRARCGLATRRRRCTRFPARASTLVYVTPGNSRRSCSTDWNSSPMPATPPRLPLYARGRQLDRRGSMAFTDGIVRIFSNDLLPLRAARGLGLLALDLVPPLRHFVAKRMIWGARAW